MATPTQEASQEASSDRATGRAGEPVSQRHPDEVNGGPGTVRVIAIIDSKTREWEGAEALAELPKLHKRPKVPVWVDLSGPSNEHVEEVGAALKLHSLIVEDILEGNQRAKLEMTDGLVHIVLFNLEYTDKMVTTEIDIVLGDGFLLTVHPPSWDPFASHHLRGGDGVEAILANGPDHLLWALSDDVVDRYFPCADRMGDAIDEVQDEVVRRANPAALEKVFQLKRELIEVRRAVGPIREIFNQLTNRDTALIDEEEVVYFRDVYDHIIRLTDELDNYRELASSTLDVYLTQVNNNLSVIMKRLTGVTVIVAGVGAVAGIFGMSEAATALAGSEGIGFWVVTASTIMVAMVAVVILRKIDWI